jgi:hypothetical protein
MRKFFQFTPLAAVAALAVVAMPASAATINLSGVQAANVNASGDDVNQAAVAVNANIGSVVGSTVDVAATVANNVATIDVETRQDASGALSGNGSLVSAGNLNVSFDPVEQLAAAGNLSGALTRTTLDVGATAANNVASTAVVTVQK